MRSFTLACRARNQHSAFALILGALALSAPTLAQEPGGEVGEESPLLVAPGLKSIVERDLAAPYLSAEEVADKRVFYGVWEPEDLVETTRRARAALLVGAYDDPSLLDDAAPAEDRAEGALERGELELALELLEGAESLRAARIRAQALEMLGRYEEAGQAVRPVIDMLLAHQIDNAPELVEGARALLIRARVEGRPPSDYNDVLALLARAHEQIDRLYWPAILVEAELLNDKDNRAEAGVAIQDVLSMNPRCARAWRLLGEMAVDGFNFDQMEGISARLERDLAYFRHGDEETAESSSHHATMLQAKAAIRQSLAEPALEALEPAIERYPLMRELLAMRIGATAVQYKNERTEELLAEFDELSPGSAEGLYRAGWAMAEARQYEDSADFLRRAIELQPNWEDPWIELGLLQLQAGEDWEALGALQRATTLDPFNLRARNSLTLIEELVTYGTIEADGFTIRFKPGVDEVMARDMVGPLEEIHRLVTGEFKHVPDRKTIIELMPDHQWFGVRIAGMPQIHTIAASTGPVMAMEAPKFGKKGLYSGPYDWVRVIRHEYVHTVTLSLTKNRIPHWFTEAAAVHMESDDRDYNTCELLTAAVTEDFLHKLDAINIAFTRPKTRYDRQLAYAQGNWMYKYILYRWGEQAPIDLMLQYRDGVPQHTAFERVLGVTEGEFFDAFKVWALDDAKSWGMIPEPSIDELLLEATLGDPEMRGEIEEKIAQAGLDLANVMTLGGELEELDLPLRELDDDLLEALLEEHPNHSELLGAEIGRRLTIVKGEPDETLIPWLERYAEARPVDPSPHRYLARLYLDSDDKSRAIPHLEYLDAREQKSASYAIELARRYAAIEDWESAWVKISRATEIAPFDPGHRELAATVALRRGDLANAERHILALTELEPDQEIHQKRLDAVRKRMGEES